MRSGTSYIKRSLSLLSTSFACQISIKLIKKSFLKNLVLGAQVRFYYFIAKPSSQEKLTSTSVKVFLIMRQRVSTMCFINSGEKMNAPVMRLMCVWIDFTWSLPGVSIASSPRLGGALTSSPSKMPT